MDKQQYELGERFVYEVSVETVGTILLPWRPDKADGVSRSSSAAVGYHVAAAVLTVPEFQWRPPVDTFAALTIRSASSGQLRLFLDVEDNFDVRRPRSDIDRYLPGARLDGTSVSLPQTVKLIAAFVDP
ncbi:hypothetical protein D6833_02080, partial [Candidatus Parcubacteria bacterium]